MLYKMGELCRHSNINQIFFFPEMCMCVYIYVYVCVCMHVCVYIYIEVTVSFYFGVCEVTMISTQQVSKPTLPARLLQKLPPPSLRVLAISVNCSSSK